MAWIPARERIASLFETFDEFGREIRSRDPIRFPGYRPELGGAEASSGEAESVITGLGTIDGHLIVAAIFDFGFLGGSMGEASGARLQAAMTRAVEMRVPFLGIISTGGARMQEGMAALAQMPRTVAASAALSRAGVPQISVLCHPTTGGVYASFASLADIVIAEADATIGFAGPRVARAMSGRPLPEGSHTAEAAFRAGLVDAVIEPGALRATLARLLRIIEAGGSIETARPGR